MERTLGLIREAHDSLVKGVIDQEFYRDTIDQLLVQFVEDDGRFEDKTNILLDLHVARKIDDAQKLTCGKALFQKRLAGAPPVAPTRPSNGSSSVCTTSVGTGASTERSAAQVIISATYLHSYLFNKIVFNDCRSALSVELRQLRDRGL